MANSGGEGAVGDGDRQITDQAIVLIAVDPLLGNLALPPLLPPGQFAIGDLRGG